MNVELLEYPGHGAYPVGRVIEILGHPDDFGVDAASARALSAASDARTRRVENGQVHYGPLRLRSRAHRHLVRR
jgi:hypothetical protein